MGTTNFLIVGGSLLVMALLGLSPAVRSWWLALTSRPGAALMLIGAMASTLIGGMGYDLRSMIPDATRLVRLGILFTLLLISLIGILKNPRCWRNAGPGTRWMLLYALFAMSSAVYSIAPILSAYKGLEVMIMVLTAVYLAGQQRDAADLRWLLNILSLILLFLTVTVLMGVIVDPGEALRAGSYESASEMTRTVRGVIGSINPSSVGGIGALMLVSALAPIFDRRTRGKLGLWLIVIMGTAAVILAHSRTAIFGATAAVIAILIFNRRMALALGIGAVGVVLALFTSIGDLVMSYIYRGQSQKLFLSMSGRTYYWGLFAERAMEAPILGHGFYAGIRVLFKTSSTDNTYLGILLDLGIVGLIIFIVPIVFLIVTLWRTRPRRSMPWHGDVLWLQIASMFVIVMLRSPVGTSFQILHNILVVYLVLHISAAAHARLWQDARSAHNAQNEASSAPPVPKALQYLVDGYRSTRCEVRTI